MTTESSKSTQNSGIIGLNPMLALGFVVSMVWILSQASFASLGAAPGGQESGALLMGIAGLIFMLRRRRRARY